MNHEHKLRLLPQSNVVFCEVCFEEWQPKAIMLPYIHVGEPSLTPFWEDLSLHPRTVDRVITTTTHETDWRVLDNTNDVYYAGVS